MRVLICGSRYWDNFDLIKNYIKTLKKGTVVIHGDAPGADSIAAHYAKKRGLEVLPFPAKWTEHGKAAGPIRNQQMLDEGKPDLVVAFHEALDESKGTRDMLRRAEKACIERKVFTGVE